MEFDIQHGEHKVSRGEKLSGEALVEETVRADGHPGPDSSKLIIATALLFFADLCSGRS